jgi:hypothetical protein
LQPHRVRQFNHRIKSGGSNDPQFATKVRDIVGLHVDPPAHAVVLSVDEKSQIQALDRTQPGLPLKKGRCGTMTHDCIRHGTTTLFAALNVLEGGVPHTRRTCRLGAAQGRTGTPAEREADLDAWLARPARAASAPSRRSLPGWRRTAPRCAPP